MKWCLSHQYDKRAVKLADRHYSRKTVGSKHFVPPGRMLVLLSDDAKAAWVTSWPYAEMLRRSWFPTAWINTFFHSESLYLSSALIREAVAVTRWHWGEPPPDGMVTIIDQRKVRSANPGYCYKKAGFKHVGYTKKAGLVIVQCLPQAYPEASMPNGAQLTFNWEVESA